MPKTKKVPFAPDQVVVATRTFATEETVVHVGEKYRGGDPVVVANHTAFVDGETLPGEMPNFWEELPAPPEHDASAGFNIRVQPSTEIPLHRQVRSKVEYFFPMQWAPGSAGERRGIPPPFGSALHKGQIKDVCDPVVRAHPDWFEFPARDVRLEDIEREEVNDGK
jgi:hypothetical protein